MAEYWVSTAKHYCKFCKVWISDNKSTILLHENGLKHKQLVKDRIKAARERSGEKVEEASALAKQLQDMNKAALAAYEADITGNELLAQDSSYKKELEEIEKRKLEEEKELQNQMQKKALKKKEEEEEEEERKKEAAAAAELETSTKRKLRDLSPTRKNKTTGMGQWQTLEESSSEEEEEKEEENEEEKKNEEGEGDEQGKEERNKDKKKSDSKVDKDDNDSKESKSGIDKNSSEKDSTKGSDVLETKPEEEEEKERNTYLSRKSKKLKKEEEHAAKIFVEKVTPSLVSKKKGTGPIAFKKRGRQNIKKRRTSSDSD